jgi:hypothetical protein
MSMYGGLIKAIIDEQGLEKALELHAKILAPYGDDLAATFAEALGGKEPDMRVFHKAVFKPAMDHWGFTTEIEADEKSLTATIPNCPMYSGYQRAGLDHGTIAKMCKAAFKAEYDALNKHYPTVHASTQPRDSADGSCIEKFVII